jgi:flagella basal body P-ring formation protein FlgA
MRAVWFLLVAALAWAQEVQVPSLVRLQQEAIVYAEGLGAGLGGTIQVRVVSPPQLPPHPGDDLRFEPSHLSKREPTGRFFAAFRVYQGPRLLGTTRVDLEGKWTGKVLQARSALARKSIPPEGALELVSLEGALPAGALTAFPEGHRLRNPVPAGKILTRLDVEVIPLVNTGDRVRLELVCGGLSVTLDTMARSPGARGDRIRLELPSRKQVQAQVTAEGEARLEWPSTR